MNLEYHIGKYMKTHNIYLKQYFYYYYKFMQDYYNFAFCLIAEDVCWPPFGCS